MISKENKKELLRINTKEIIPINRKETIPINPINNLILIWIDTTMVTVSLRNNSIRILRRILSTIRNHIIRNHIIKKLSKRSHFIRSPHQKTSKRIPSIRIQSIIRMI